jgi:hypothetical protein
MRTQRRFLRLFCSGQRHARVRRVGLLFFSVVSIVVLQQRLAFRADAAEESSIELLQDGKSPYCIVLEPSCSPSEKYAAEELQTHFKACTGAELPMVVGKPAEARPMIVLGRGPIATELGVAPSDESLGPQGCLLRTVPPHLVIAGTRQAGTLYGVHHFLERELGVRWFTPDVTDLPKRKNVSLGDTDQIIRPGFLWRQASYAWPGGDADFRGRRGMNAGDGDQNCRLGEQYSFDGTCHSYFQFVSPEEFFDSHPEYFSEINGRRVREETQLCLTNPDVLKIVTERMLQHMKDRPHDRQHNFSQMDWYNYCECLQCQAMNEKCGTTGGTQFWFVNELAKRTSKVFPDKLIGTLAYTYTEKPPRDMTMHANVAVWLCHMFPCCDSHPIEQCPLNADYNRRAETWSNVCPHLYVWHYIVNFAHYYTPFPNFRALAADMRFYQSLGVEGVFAQAMGHEGGGGEFSLLRGYYVTELLKNPQQSSETILREFLAGYYGAAAEPIWRYIELLDDKVQQGDIHMHLYVNPAQGYLTDEVLAKATALFDEAEGAVKDDPVLSERVRVARMPLTYARMFPRNGYKIEQGSLVFVGPLAGLSEVGAFVDRMERHGFKAIRELAGDANQLLPFAAMFQMRLPLVTLRNEYLQVDVAPFWGGRALRILDRKTGQCVTAYNTTRNLVFPFCGGEDSRNGGAFDILGDGPVSQTSVVSVSDTSIALEAKLSTGFTMRRTLTLAPDRPSLHILAEFVNSSNAPRTALVRSRLSLDLGDVRTTRVGFMDRTGRTVDEDMTETIAGLREGKSFYRDKCPKGAWTFSGDKGLKVVQRFDAVAADFTRLGAYPADLNELEVELWGRPATLQPGESARLEHDLEIGAPDDATAVGR